MWNRPSYYNIKSILCNFLFIWKSHSSGWFLDHLLGYHSWVKMNIINDKKYRKLVDLWIWIWGTHHHFKQFLHTFGILKTEMKWTVWLCHELDILVCWSHKYRSSPVHWTIQALIREIIRGNNVVLTLHYVEIMES